MFPKKNHGMVGAYVRRVIAGVAVAVLLGGIAVTLANPLAPDTVIRAPQSVTVQSSPSLPAEAQALEQQSAANLFDRDTTTEHVTYDASHVVARFDAPTEVRDVKFYGAAPYTVSVDAEVGGAWQQVGGLQNLNLTQRPQSWSTFSATAPVTAAALRFNLTPAAGGSATGLKAVEIWGRGARVNVRDGLALINAMRSSTPPSQGRLYAAALSQGVIGGTGDDPADNTFTVTIDRDPGQFKRAYLAYEMLGLSHWVNPNRSINGRAPLGGFAMPAGADWTTQVERIDPSTLAASANRIVFSAPTNQARPYTVRNVYLVGELESGANFVSAVAANQLEENNPSAHLVDGNLATGWTPYPSGTVRADTPTVALALDKPTQLDGVALYLVNALRGSIAVELQVNGLWTPSGATAVDARRLVAGWNTIAVPSGVAAQGVRLVFSGGPGSSAEIKELQAIGSGAGPATPAQFVLSFPDAGQFYGRTAYLRGFLHPAVNASGPAQIFAGSVAVNSDGGAFGFPITKDDLGQGAEGDSDPWTVELRAVYPDGTTVTRTVPLNSHQPAVESTDGNLLPTYQVSLSPGQARKLAYDAAGLDVPADALGSELNVGITPLKAEDLAALDTGMTNVTKGPRRGYRFTPTPMKFKAKLRVTLPYSKAAIPPGLTEDDVRTFYFDVQTGRWKALDLVALDKQAQTVTSATDHFTDMINATVTVPDHPQTASFNPTQLKGIKAADPGAQVNLIDPPPANAMGDARMAYPLEVPPGRQGMQPQLAVQYSSAGGNGWLGLGWDVPMHAVVVDTRWGAARYDAAAETETYTLNGEQLTPLAHRGPAVPRTADKVFHARVEGQFNRIVRRGNSPANYRWEVTDKHGVRYFYGAASDATGPQADATLADDHGNMFLWALREVIDPNGNHIRYSYARVEDPGVQGGTVPGSNLYLKRIAYTGHGGVDGAYTVTFTRDRELGEPRRPDVQIDARGGFKRVTADLLRRVDVAFNGSLVRRYELQYAIGAFNKTLLQQLIQYADDGVTEFNRHRFAYHDEARQENGAYRGFAPTAPWGVGSDNVSAGLFGRGNASALGGSKGTSGGAHLYVGVGPTGSTSSKVNTVGVKVGYSRTKNEGLLTMADMNGDGLPDKVFKTEGGGFHYRPNQSGPRGTPTFGAPVALPSMPAISQERTSSYTYGAEAYVGSFFVAAHRNDASTRADTYFADVNGDGLTDLVSRGQVLFGYLNTQGVPTFSPNSALTPVAIQGGLVDANGLIEVTPEELAREAERANAFPLVDTLRRWVAPHDGIVSVTAPVQLIQDTSEERNAYTSADGVRVAIQLEAAQLWSATIGATDYEQRTPTGVNAITVRRGDRLYFRVQAVNNGAYDRVQWSPVITYTAGVPASTDVNGLDRQRYVAAEDYTLAGRRGSVTLPLAGTLRLGGRFEKIGATTDDVTLLVTRNGAEVLRERFAFGEARSFDIAREIEVAQGDVMEWRVLADSPIDLASLRFPLPLQAYYTAATGVETVQNDAGEYVVSVRPTYDIDTYAMHAPAAPQQAWIAPTTGTVTVQPALGLNLEPNVNSRVVFTAKKAGALLGKLEIPIVNGALPDPATLALTLSVTQGDAVYFDFSTRDAGLATALVSQGVSIGGQSVPSAFHAAALEGAFPRPYRGWAVAGYNGNGSRATQPVQQAALVVDDNFNPETSLVQVFVPQPGADLSQDQWGALGAEAWVRPAAMSASRLGTDDVRLPRSEAFAGATAPARLSKSRNDSVSGGGGPAGGARSGGSSQSQVDFMDLNGDQFPDVVSEGGVQYTLTTGELEGQRRTDTGLGTPRFSENVTDSLDVSFSGAGGGNAAVAIAGPRGLMTGDGRKGAGSAQQGADMPALGFSLSGAVGSSVAQYDLIDINADGLPDRVGHDGNVQLNLGYRFAASEPWGGGPLNEGASADVGGGINAGFNRDAYSIAGGLSLTISKADTKEVYVDINGDGLPDKVSVGDGGALRVRLNTGSRYLEAIAWPQGHAEVSVDKRLTLGGGAYFTFGWNFFYVRVVINPGANLSTTMGRPEYAFRDVDGDGYVDQLFSDRDSELSVAANPIGRTNLLRRVERPLGASFDLEYTRDGNTYDMPQSRWLLTKVSLHDGVPGDGVDRQVATYRYEGGRYSRLEREFFGYARVMQEQRDAANGEALHRTVTREYRNDTYYTKGLLAAEVTADAAGRRFNETLHTYVLRDVQANIEPVDGSSVVATIFPQLRRTEHRFYEGGPSAQKSTYTDRRYDALGNVVHFADAGDVGAADDVEAFIDYSADDTACASRHIVGIARSINVIGNGRLMRERSAVIDCASGDVTRVTQLTGNGQAAVTDLAYFANGNLQSITGPANRNGQRYALTYSYDTVVATHVTQITDSFGYVSQATHNLKYAKVETTTDVNNRLTTTVYDNVGRMATVTGPYEQGTGQATIRFVYQPHASVPYALTQHVDKDAAGVLRDPIETLLYTDGLKRVLQTKKDASVFAGADATPQNAMVVSGRVLFDHVGRTVQQFYPTTEAKGGNLPFNAGFDAVAPTRIEYDVLDRAVRTTIPDGTSARVDHGFGADRTGATQFQTTVTDANGKVKQTYHDVRELITSVKEHNQGSVIWTSYAYDPLRQIMRVTDDRGNATSVAHDNLGRRTSIDNPDIGRTNLEYDPAGNLIAKATATLHAQGTQIVYDYEFNRLRSITYPNFPANNVTYQYGAPGAADGRAGRISRITSQMGSEERFYGPLGEVVREVKTINTFTTPNAPEIYTTQYQYDTWNRLMRLTYPDGEVLTYRYDSGGLPAFAQGVKSGYTYDYLRRMEYDKFEQRAFSELGNGVRTTYAYDPRNRRLATLQAGKGGGGNLFQNLVYGYDNVGNITSLNNEVPVPQPNQYGGPTAQRFGYDDLYRLTQAEGSYAFAPGKQRTYRMDVAYDSIHNITSKSQSDVITQPSGTPITQKKTSYAFTYAYGSSRPHAPTHIGDRTFTYDANGNQAGWTDDNNGTRRNIVWDDENRIQSLFDNGHEKTYKYDDDGERVIKRGPQGETVYVNQNFTIRNKEVGTKHVFVGTSRLVSKLMKQDKPGANPQGHTPVEKDLYYFHADHLGSSHYVTDTQGQPYEHLEYFPFGEMWVEEASNTQRTPYLFTGKELDEETGLYYHGARYYDPRTSVWQSADRVLGRYLEGALNSGVFNSFNLNVFGYAYQNPLRLIDPDGNAPRVKFPEGAAAKVTPEIYDAAMGAMKIRNMKLAGQKHPVTNVPFDAQGFPDFSAHLFKGANKGGVPIKSDVNIGELTGRMDLDEALANAAAGLKETPKGYTWHHHQQLGRLQLVRRSVHAKTGHTGGDNIFRKAVGIALALGSSAANATAADYAEFAFDVVLPFTLTPGELAPGTLYGPGTRFPTYEAYQKFHRQKAALESERQKEEVLGQ